MNAFVTDGSTVVISATASELRGRDFDSFSRDAWRTLFGATPRALGITAYRKGDCYIIFADRAN